MASDLIIRIGAKSDQFKDELDKIKKQTKNLESQLGAIAKISGVAFAGLSAVIGVAVKDFVKFDNELRGVKTLLNESSFGAKGLEKGFSELKKEVLDLGAKVPVSLSSLNKSLFDTVSAGVEAGKAINVLESSAKLAVAGLTDVSVATDGITSALNAYQLSAEQAEGVASKFFAAQVAGKTTIAELSQFFGKAGATASAFGVSLDELLASVSAVTTGGVKTRSAYTGLNAALANISKPTKEAAEEAKRLGIEFNSNQLRADGLSKFLKNLTDANGFTKDSVEKLFGSIEAQKFIFALTGAQAETFADTLAKLGDEAKSTTTFQEAYKTQSESLENQIKNLQGAMLALRIEIGELLAPTIGKIVGFLSDFTEKVRSLDDDTKKNIATVLKWGAGITGLIAAGAAFGVAILKLSAVLTALGAAFLPASVAASSFWVAVTGPVGLAIAGIAAVGAAIGGLFAFLKKDEEPKALKSTNTELEKLQKKREEILEQSRSSIPLFRALEDEPKNIDEINSKLDELKAKRSELVNEEKSSIPLFNGIRQSRISGIEEEIASLEELKKVELEIAEVKAQPPTVGAVADSAEDVNKLKSDEDKKTEIVNEAILKRRQAAADDLEIARARQQQKTDEEIGFLERRQDIRNQFAEADKIKDEAEKSAVLETLKIKNQELLDEENAFRAAKDEQNKTYQDTLAQLDADQQELLKGLRNQRDLEELESIKKQGQSKLDIEKEFALKALRDQQKANKTFLQEEKRYGTAYALINQAMHSSIYQGTKSAFGNLAQLQTSSNKTLKSIGKAAAIANIIISTAESAMSVYKGFATIPIVGQGLGVAAAAAAVAFGATQIAQVKGAKDGALVTSGLSGIDSNPFMLAKGELVAPEKSFDEVVEGTARQRGFTKGDEGSMSNELLREISDKLDNVQGGTVINGDVLAEETFIDTLIEKINDRIEFGNAQLRI